ncbi:PIN domain-containing protein [Streptomyces sp. NPDC048504]|uniref:PIN domain-containing protein n=1 Tax=Streptomyces sp. NPDC048504 TaxID=3365559 RepID=UPI003722E1F9
MIILDTSILRSFSPGSSSADLLRAIRALHIQEVAVPWMVLEELVAQQAVKYREKYEKTVQAVEAPRAATPWRYEVPIGSCDLDRVRSHWRAEWLNVVDQIPTSADALREGLFREANNLPPCRTVKDLKIGARDAAIWLSAVEYARERPEETVYFVSGNTNDFGSGESYPFPMDEDLAGLDDRFVHLTNMDEVATHFTERVATDRAAAESILASGEAASSVVSATYESLPLPMDGTFQVTVPTQFVGEFNVIPAEGWMTTSAAFRSAENIQTYRIGNHEWCTAVVQWHLGGVVFGGGSPVSGGCSWTTSVLFTLSTTEPRLTVLRAETPQPLTVEEFEALGLPTTQMTSAEANTLYQLFDSHRWGLPRAYEGSLIRKARKKQHPNVDPDIM